MIDSSKGRLRKQAPFFPFTYTYKTFGIIDFSTNT